MAAVFLDIDIAFDTTWRLGLLYKLSELTFSISLIKHIIYFPSRRKFSVSVEGELSTPRDIQAGFRPVPHTVHINDTPQTPGVYLGLFADDTCIYAIGREEGYVLRNLERGLGAIETWCERWNIKITEDKTQVIYFSQRISSLEAHLILYGRNIPFVNHVKYLGVISENRITWKLHIEMTEANAFKTFIRMYHVLKNERLGANMKIILHKALISSVMTHAIPAWKLAADTQFLNLQRLRNKVFRTENSPKCTLAHDLHTAFNLPYI
jgi:hypothetical protein